MHIQFRLHGFCAAESTVAEGAFINAPDPLHNVMPSPKTQVARGRRTFPSRIQPIFGMENNGSGVLED